MIFILLSIKTRIETFIAPSKLEGLMLFLSYYPLKQGLKPHCSVSSSPSMVSFLSYYPLKQGLKPCEE